MRFLKGKFFIEDLGEIFRTGEILEADDNFVYLKFDYQQMSDQPVNQGCVLSTMIIASSMIDEETEIPAWSFFDTREDLTKYFKWITSPDKSKSDDGSSTAKIVPIKGH